jgi:2-amino-4-hydroxy-6-hydroxymethyldihydropteridine diphosphokinase
MNKAYLAYGSNLGDSILIIEKALRMIENNGMKIVKKSKVYETEPYGYTDQPKFINGVIQIETEMGCRGVLEKILSIEIELGRVREFHWGPRVIDLDIIFYNDEIYNDKDLIVPHPDMQNRDFVLKPLNDICPEYVHPILGKSVLEMLGDLNLIEN